MNSTAFSPILRFATRAWLARLPLWFLCGVALCLVAYGFDAWRQGIHPGDAYSLTYGTIAAAFMLAASSLNPRVEVSLDLATWDAPENTSPDIGVTEVDFRGQRDISITTEGGSFPMLYYRWCFELYPSL